MSAPREPRRFDHHAPEGEPVSWREVNPLYWRRRLREAHCHPRNHPHRNFTAIELRYLRRTAATDDLQAMRNVIRRNLGRT